MRRNCYNFEPGTEKAVYFLLLSSMSTCKNPCFRSIFYICCAQQSPSRTLRLLLASILPQLLTSQSDIARLYSGNKFRYAISTSSRRDGSSSGIVKRYTWELLRFRLSSCPSSNKSVRLYSFTKRLQKNALKFTLCTHLTFNHTVPARHVCPRNAWERAL